MTPDEHNPEGTDFAAQGHYLAASNPTPPTIHRITPDNPPQFPCFVFSPSRKSGPCRGWYQVDGPDEVEEADTHWCQSLTRPTVTPDAPTPPAATPTPTLPPEVREAIARHIYNTPYDGLFVPMRTNVDAFCAALAPLWPRQATATADARELAAKIRGYNGHADLELCASGSMKKVVAATAAVLAPVLARAEAAERERDQLRAEVERLTGVVEARIQEIKHGWSEYDRLRAQLAAAQADKERLDWLLRPADHAESKLSVAVFRNNVGAGWITTRDAIDQARREGGAT